MRIEITSLRNKYFEYELPDQYVGRCRESGTKRDGTRSLIDYCEREKAPSKYKADTLLGSAEPQNKIRYDTIT